MFFAGVVLLCAALIKYKCIKKEKISPIEELGIKKKYYKTEGIVKFFI